MSRKSSKILWYQEVEEHDVSLIGKNNLKLAEMAQAGFTLPEGFIITSSAYFLFLHQNKLIRRITQLLETLNYEQQSSLEQVAGHVQKLIRESPLSDELTREIDSAYTKLSGVFTHVSVNIKPSVTSEDLATPALVGEIHHAAKITGETNIILEIKKAWASLFTPAGLLYRHGHNIDHFRLGLSLRVERIITAKTSGKLFTFDPLTHDKSIVCIETPEAQYHVTKKTYEIIHQQKAKHTLTEKQLRDLAHIGERLEEYAFFPQEITWAIDNAKIYLLATKPALTQNLTSTEEHSLLAEKLRLLATGKPLFPGIVTGRAMFVGSKADATQVQHGDIVIVPRVTRELLPALKKASGFLSQKSDASVEIPIARELGIPAVTGVETNITTATVITIDGKKGTIYKGVPHVQQTHAPTATKLYASLNDFSLAEDLENDECDGLILEPHTLAHGTPLALAKQIALCAKRLRPHPVLYCFADDKASLLGFHGAYQILHQQENFLQELEAIRIAHEQLHCNNVSVLLPYVRTIKELIELQHLLADKNINRDPHMKHFLQIALPANVMSLENFIEAGIDGLVIDVDTLTTLTLGIDKDDSHIANTFDPRNEAVLWAIHRTITTAHRYHIPVILAGATISLYPSVIKQSIEWGVTSIAAQPKYFSTTKQQIVTVERELITKEKTLITQQ